MNLAELYRRVVAEREEAEVAGLAFFGWGAWSWSGAAFDDDDMYRVILAAWIGLLPENSSLGQRYGGWCVEGYGFRMETPIMRTPLEALAEFLAPGSTRDEQENP